VTVEILADDAAVPAIAEAVVITIAAITRPIVAVRIAPSRTDPDANANRARAYPNALRVCGH
jgi:hypothetical protein